MQFEEFQRVRVVTNRFRTDGIQPGDVGYVIEVYSGGVVEVEFSNADGISYGQIVANPTDIESAE